MDLDYLTADTIGTVVLNNPSDNLFSSSLLENREQLGEFLLRPELKGVVIKSNGTDFCEGAAEDYYAQDTTRIEDFYRTIAFATVPVAAVITGNCMGPGLEIVLSCHFRFAVENAQFGLSRPDHGNRTLHLPFKEAVADPEIIAKVLSGSIVDADEAKTMGLVDETETDKNIETIAQACLLSITENRSARLTRTIMQSIHNSRCMDSQKALAEESRLFDSIVKNWRIEEETGSRDTEK